MPLEEFVLDFTQHHLFSFYDRTQGGTITFTFWYNHATIKIVLIDDD